MYNVMGIGAKASVLNFFCQKCASKTRTYTKNYTGGYSIHIPVALFMEEPFSALKVQEAAFHMQSTITKGVFL